MNAAAHRPLRVWCVLDHKPGHRNLARGMVAAVAAARAAVITEVAAPAWAGPIGKGLQFCWPLGASLARRASTVPTGEAPDLVVGSGGNALWFTAALARAVGATGVFVGSRRRLPVSAVGAFVHYDPTLAAEGTLCLPILPGPFGKQEQSTAWRTFAGERQWPEAQRHLVALIGGDGSGYRWSPEDGRQLGQMMRGLQELTGRTWLVTTSRRTPAEFESVLRAELPAAAVGDACWFHAGDQRRVVSAYLGGAAAVFVSEDSMSMIHEGITSGQRVVTLRPVAATPPPSHQAYIEHAVGQGWIRSEPLAKGAPSSLASWLSAGGGYAGDALADMGRTLLAHLERQGKLAR